MCICETQFSLSLSFFLSPLFPFLSSSFFFSVCLSALSLLFYLSFTILHFPVSRDQIFHIPVFPHLYRYYSWSHYGYTSNFNVLFPLSICKNKWILCIYRTIINIDGSVAILSHLLFNVNSWLLLYDQRDCDTFYF